MCESDRWAMSNAGRSSSYVRTPTGRPWFQFHYHAPVTPAISLHGVHVSRGRAGAVLRGLDLDIAPGETIALVGRSGAGKSTVLKTINGLIAPEQGEVLVEGRATSAWNPFELRRRIGYVLQEIGLFPHLTVA